MTASTIIFFALISWISEQYIGVKKFTKTRSSSVQRSSSVIFLLSKILTFVPIKLETQFFFKYPHFSPERQADHQLCCPRSSSVQKSSSVVFHSSKILTKKSEKVRHYLTLGEGGKVTVSHSTRCRMEQLWVGARAALVLLSKSALAPNQTYLGLSEKKVSITPIRSWLREM